MDDKAAERIKCSYMNPFENHNADPIQEDVRLVREVLDKDLAAYPSPTEKKKRLCHLLDSRSTFVDPSASHMLQERLDAYEGNDPIGFIMPLAVEIWKREGKYENPLKYKAKLFRADREKDGYIFLNDVFYYGKENGYAHIHLNNPYSYADADTPGAKLLVLRSFIKGLSELAKILGDDDQVKNISATSNLLTNPAMAEMLESVGFKNLGPISQETRQQYFRGDNRPINRMEADKVEFCKKAKDAKALQEKLMVAIKSLRGSRNPST